MTATSATAAIRLRAGGASESSRDRLDDALLIGRLEARVEGDRQRAPAQALGHGAEPLGEAVALAHVRLQVDARQVARGADPLALEVPDHGLTVEPLLELDDVDEPGASVVGVVR